MHTQRLQQLAALRAFSVRQPTRSQGPFLLQVSSKADSTKSNYKTIPANFKERKKRGGVRGRKNYWVCLWITASLCSERNQE